ncbi:MAG: acetyl-CoA carboxylase biotin carboxyl carrier protein subunit [Bacteroidales bacterium]|nr:acetyl-CoA carboxylase biotin carboxyl carrier protein subunit [Bacteroidales bacterium]
MKKWKNKEIESKSKFKTLNIDGTCYKTNLTSKFENRKKYTVPNAKKVISVIPGTIVKVFVKEGQKVKRGDNILILEAMKMQNRIKSPRPGVIKSIKVKEGEKIAKGMLMMELE